MRNDTKNKNIFSICKKSLIIIVLTGLWIGFPGCRGIPPEQSSSVQQVQQYNSEQVTFSKKHGFYNKPFSVELFFDEPGAVITYTVDGSFPSEKSGILYTDPVLIKKTTILRAMAYKINMAPTPVSTQTYIFLEDVKNQKRPGNSEWPRGFVNYQIMDYEMDPDIVKHKHYRKLIDKSLLSLSTLSLVTEPGNLINKKRGIYANSLEKGEEWERPVSVELIYPDNGSDKEGFQINAGLRIRGAYSRVKNNPKHSFRLYFKNKYGTPNLRYPIFDFEGVDEFDKMDLRTSQNYSWAKEGSSRNTMVREIFSRDIMRAMGQPYTRSRYIHLYINGLYWGVYQTQERADSFYAHSYFHGKRDDYDVIKVDCGPLTGDFEIEVTDGTFDAYGELHKLMKKGFQDDKDYYYILGKNIDNSINLDYKVMVDEINLIDYMLVVYYTGNFDAPITRFRGDREPNNFYALYDRNGWYGWKFIMHDAEHSMFNVHEDRIGPFTIRPDFKYFNPGYLHQKLLVHKEYKMKFIDRVYKYFYEDGIFVPENALEIMKKRIDEVELAIIAESARWGNSKKNSPLTKKDWQREIDYLVENYIPRRRDIVVEQLKRKELYPDTTPPYFFIKKKRINTSKLKINDNTILTVTNPNRTGRLFYTLDGSDPRAVGGNISDTVLGGKSTDFTVKLTTTTIVKSRVKDNDQWSPLQEVTFFMEDESYNGLIISEIHYNPADRDDINGTEYEFIELYNAGDSPVNLTAAGFTRGIDFTFPHTIVSPEERIIIVKNNRVFLKYYGKDIPVTGSFLGTLDNGGETLTLTSPSGKTIIEMTYNDTAPWPVAADGSGYSIEMTDPGLPLNQGENWSSSRQVHGTPGGV